MIRAILIAGLVSAAPAFALEHLTAELQNGRKTSALQEVSLKPIFVFSARGRRDPFVFDVALTTSHVAVSKQFSIAELNLTGFLGAEGNTVVIFKNWDRGTSYTFKGGKLYSPENVPIANVSGIIHKDRSITLVQGESRMDFVMGRNARLESMEAVVEQDRKESQR